MKYYARQVAPEYQESPLILFDDWPDDMAVTGNRGYNSHCPEIFTEILNVLNDGYLMDYLNDMDYPGAILYGCYKNATAAIMDFLYPQHKAKYSTKEIGKIKRIVLNWDGDDDDLCTLLTIVTGHEWRHGTIKGSCQGDWQGIYYVAENWSREALNAFEVEYFNEGSEWIVHDGEKEPDSPDDIAGYSCYCTAWDKDGIKAQLRDRIGVGPDDEIIMYAHDGYTRVDKYRLVS